MEPPGRGDALRHLRMEDGAGTSLWWRSYVSLQPARKGPWASRLRQASRCTVPVCVWHTPPLAPRFHQLSSSLNWRPRMQGRNRRCITIDLHNEEGRQVLRQLANRCDVLVENFRPGVMEKWQAGRAGGGMRARALVVTGIAARQGRWPFARK